MAATETWPIQEFTYLAPARCINTTVADRKVWVDEYWAKADPAFVHGEGAESFLEFIQRVQVFLDRLADAPGNQVAVFSHGQFMSALAWLLVRRYAAPCSCTPASFTLSPKAPARLRAIRNQTNPHFCDGRYTEA